MNSHLTLAIIGNWVEYADNQKIWRASKKVGYILQPRDLVIFDKLLSENLLYYIALVLDCNFKKKAIESAQGNVDKPTSIFK